MCLISMLGDFYTPRFKPYVEQWPWVPSPPVVGVSRDEFDALKREVEEMKELLKAAKRIDELTGQPDCETDEKMAVLRKIAELVGVELPP